jgi:HK97 family phage portal protein
MQISKAWRAMLAKARAWSYTFRLDGTGYRGQGYNTSAGVYICGETALNSATFFACTNIIGTTIAHLGFDIYRERKSGTKELATAHPLHEILHYEPNRQQTAHEFWQKHFFELEIYGNGYSEIERQRSNGIIALKQWDPQQVDVLTDRGPERIYKFQPDKGSPIERAEHGADDNLNVMHLRNVTMDGVRGISTAQLAKQRLGIDFAVESYAATFFRKGGRFKDIFEFDKVLQPEQRDKFNTLFRENYHAGPNGGHDVLLLEAGIKYANKSGATPNEAQFNETQTSNAIAICRYSGVPPTLVGILDRATYNNQEQLMLQFLTLGIAPRADRAEQSLRRSLLTKDDKSGGYYIHSKVQKLMRADTKTRAEFYKTLMSLGALSANEIRDLEDMPRIEDPAANEYVRAQNLFGPPADPAEVGAEAGAEAGREEARRQAA